jgi:transposase
MPERDELPQANQGAGEITPLSVADQPRYARALEARQLHARGWLQKDIARHLACHPKTVRRDLAQMLPLTARSGARTSILDPYKPYLLERWNAGCHNASQLLREIQPLGYHGGATTVGSFVVTLRRHSGLPGRRSARDRAVGAPLPAATIARLPAPRQLAWLCTQPVSVLDADQRAMRAALGTVSGTVATAVTLAQSFATMVRDRQAGTLEAWLASGSRCGIAAFRSLANGLRADHAAVAAALTVEWSNGRTEGKVNRLKCVKRQMYGRGKLDLLRVRLLAT